MIIDKRKKYLDSNIYNSLKHTHTKTQTKADTIMKYYLDLFRKKITHII